jgi:hypothetical protein
VCFYRHKIAATKRQDERCGGKSKEKRFFLFCSFPAGVKLRIRADELGNEATLDP